MVIRLLMAAVLLIASAAAAQADNHRLLQDHLGRRVTIPRQVKRIIPLGGATRLVVYLKAFDLVVGVEGMESRQPISSGRPYNLAIRSQAEKLPLIGEGRQRSVNAELIMTLRPDLLISTELDAPQADRLSSMTGVPVLVLDYGGVGTLELEKVKDCFRLLGDALGREKRASELVTELDRQTAELARRSAGGGGKRVYVGGISLRGSHGISSSDTDYFPLDVVGGVNVTKGGRKRGHIQIDREQLLLWNPPLILVDAGGERLIRGDMARNRPYYNRLAAFRNGQFYRLFPYNYYHTNLELALANSWYIGKLLYPSRFADLDPARMTDQLCRLFVGIDCYQRLSKEFGGFGPLQLGQEQGNGR